MVTYGTFPPWLHALAIASVVLGVACAAAVTVDEIRHPQKMTVMNFVWPLTALFGSLLWVAGYYAWGRNAPAKTNTGDKPSFAATVMKGTSHCGAGCTLGDIVVEWAAYLFPAVAVWFGWHRLFDEKMFAVWIPDFMLAFLLGILFQYFTIKPMRNVSPGEGLVAALKADVASITAWQIGMYGVMALIQLAWFRNAYGGIASVASPEFWFAMQLAMLAGFATSYPVNWWLVRTGVKEKM
ncbi:MAG TPA: DUF4396 domain-containing protein [Paraburkholderia sp.]|jgi:hypothetical protein|nr:DUF4396 domain-containing protein [Paraburkholderia sp.]